MSCRPWAFSRGTSSPTSDRASERAATKSERTSAGPSSAETPPPRSRLLHGRRGSTSPISTALRASGLRRRVSRESMGAGSAPRAKSASFPSVETRPPAEWRASSGWRKASSMATIAWISAATVAGGVISIAIAAMFALSAPASWVPALVSFAIGTLLGAVCLEILPHAIVSSGNLQALFATVLAGILGFFVLEKLVLWRHCHIEDCEAHDHHADTSDGGRSGLMIIIGDGFHNFVDGILIAAAFLQSTELGVVTAAAIIAHEIPQEIGDFDILLHSGYSKFAALALNLLSSLAMLIGALLAYFTLQAAQQWIGTVLALAAASMIYVAVADLIPGLHRTPELHATAQQVALIALGVALIWFVGDVVRAA